VLNVIPEFNTTWC